MENLFKCVDENCDSQDFELIKKGPNTGLYCAKCKKYIKFLGKTELKLAEEYIARRNSTKQQVIEVDGYKVVLTPNTITLFCHEQAIFQRPIDRTLFI